MDIALLNQIITIQKVTIVVDAIGNRISNWTDYYQCHATISNESGSETKVAGQELDSSTICFTVRYCNSTALVTSLEYRIMFNNDIYNIVNIDHLNYKRKALKFKCEKVRR